jgi:hypothetical protein
MHWQGSVAKQGIPKGAWPQPMRAQRRGKARRDICTALFSDESRHKKRRAQMG